MTKSLTLTRRHAMAGLGAALLPLNKAYARPLPNPPSRFPVYGVLLHEGRPDVQDVGLRPLYLVDRGIWGRGRSHLAPPDPGLIRDRIARFPDNGAPIVMDFEQFSMADADIERTREALAIIAGQFQRFAGNRPIGFYDYLPRRDYWRAIRMPGSSRYSAWQRDNNVLASLERRVDMLFPSIYTFYDDVAGWETYARAQVREARRLSDKPVVPFLWNDYHYNGSFGAQRPIPAEYWRFQLELMQEIADGVVIWAGWDAVNRSRQRWNPRAPWWRETQAFLRTLR